MFKFKAQKSFQLKKQTDISDRRSEAQFVADEQARNCLSELGEAPNPHPPYSYDSGEVELRAQEDLTNKPQEDIRKPIIAFLIPKILEDPIDTGELTTLSGAGGIQHQTPGQGFCLSYVII